MGFKDFGLALIASILHKPSTPGLGNHGGIAC